MASGVPEDEAGHGPEETPVIIKSEMSPLSAASDHGLFDTEAEAEKHLMRKIDITIYPILFVVYMLSFLDRINISNAKIQGLTEDLDMSGNRFNIALFVSRLAHCFFSPVYFFVPGLSLIGILLMLVLGLLYPVYHTRSSEQYDHPQSETIVSHPATF